MAADATALPWMLLADLVLQREAAACRIAAGVPPHDFAGLYVSDEEVDALLRTLPGLDGPSAADLRRVGEPFDEPLRAARAALEEWAAHSTDPLARCCRTLDLDAVERDALALVAAVETSPRRQRLVAYVQDSVQLPRLTVATLRRVLPPSGDRSVAPGAPLRRGQLVDVESGGPWAVRQCGLAPRLAWALRGDELPDPDLPVGARVLPVTAPHDDDASTLLLVHGGDSDGRVETARRHVSGPSVVTPLPSTDDEWHAVVREATIRAGAVVLDLAGVPSPEAAAHAERARHLRWAWCAPREIPVELLPRVARHEIALRDGTASEEEWLRLFGVPAPAGTRLSTGQLRHVAAVCGGDVSRLGEGIRRLAGGHLDTLAVRIRPRRTWADLVLAPDQGRQLHDLAARYRARATVYESWGFAAVPSTGVVALFAGPSGTGKTLAAEVLASDLGLDLYKVDLSSVVSKWVGETEKNLERIFDAAQARELVLFFDEADALFGKRSEVSDAHDRYANIEVSYLLQRLETYDGLVVLATNLQRNIDQAFLRRISVAVEFTIPDEEQRRGIWRRVFPPAAPLDGIDVDFLARQLKVTGGIIRNAALTAAFLAADADEPITMDGVMLAVDREFTKMGRLRSPAEFAHYYDLVQGRRAGGPADRAVPTARNA